MNVVVFSEEYAKITKGLFVVWTTHVIEASKRHTVKVLLNREHWAYADAKTLLRDNQTSIHRLPFELPSTFVKRLFPSADNLWLLRAMRYALGQGLNWMVAPFAVLLLAVKLRQLGAGAVFSHSGGWPAGQLCRWIICGAMVARVPFRIIVIHSHPRASASGPFAALSRPLGSMQAKLIDLCATAVVTVSDSVKAILASQVFSSSVHRIHNGIQLGLPGASDGSLQWAPNGAAVGFVGALNPSKGPHILLDAFRMVRVPCELAMLGPPETEFQESLEQKAGKCANKVTFLGFQEDVDSFMARIDLLVVPSIAYESFGIVILEAMRHKKPVICSDFGGMKEVVAHGVTGLVVPAGDKHALADAITAVLSDEEMRRSMGEAGYRRLMDLFTSDKMAAQYEQLIIQT